MPEVNGETRLIGVVADPIAHVRTPEVLNRFLEAADRNTVVVPMHLPAARLRTAWEGLRGLDNLAGLIVTVPHKTAVPGLCDALGDDARLTGAANAVRRMADGRYVGEMFDGRGFVEGLGARGIDPRGHEVLLLGAGGAASAIAFALARSGIARLTIANRTTEKALRLAERVRAAYPEVTAKVGSPADAAGHSLVVNGTSLGLRADDPLPLDPALLSAPMTVAEVIMRPARTRLLAAAEEAGCRVHEGIHMLQAQLALLAEFLAGDGAGDE